MLVKDMLLLCSFKGCSLVAGGEGLSNEVRELAVMEVPDIDDYLLPQDFLLTTLYPVHKNEQELQSLIVRLKKLGVSGIGIKLNRYVKQLPEHILTTAGELGFPVVILPANGNFSLMITDFLKRSMQIQNQKLAFRDELHQRLMEIMLSDQDYGGLCAELSTILNREVVLLDRERLVLSCFPESGREGLGVPEILEVHTTRALPEYREQGGYSVYTACNAKRIVGYIAVRLGDDGPLSALEKLAIEEFALVFGIISQNKAALARMELHYFSEFISDLLLRETEVPEDMSRRARALGLLVERPQSILVLLVERLSQEFSDRGVLLVRVRKLLKESGVSIAWANVERYLVAFIDRSDEKAFQQMVERISGILKALGVKRFFIGVSQPSQGMAHYHHCYEEAKRALAIAKWNGQRNIMFAEQMGVYRIIHASSNREELLDFSNELLKNIIAYDTKNGTELLHMLAIFIENGGNLKETAKVLYIHYNTARYRFKLLCQLTGKNLQRFDELSDLNLALKVHMVFGGNS